MKANDTENEKQARLRLRQTKIEAIERQSIKRLIIQTLQLHSIQRYKKPTNLNNKNSKK